MLVLAGAGTGKTAALTARLAHLLYTRKAWPSEMLARHLHQQGGARDEGPGRPHRRRGGRGHALARHLPFDRRQDAAPPRRAGRAQEQFHHPRHRRPAAADEAADPRRRHRREKMAGADARRDDRPLEEQGLDPGPGRCRRGRGLCQRQGRQALRALPGAAARPQRLRFRRSAAAHAGDPQEPPRRARTLPAALPLHPRRRISGHQPGPVSLAPPARPGAQEHLLRRRRRPVDLFVARRRGLQHPAVREGFPGREDHPARAELPLDPAHPRRRLRA